MRYRPTRYGIWMVCLMAGALALTGCDGSSGETKTGTAHGPEHEKHEASHKDPRDDPEGSGHQDHDRETHGSEGGHHDESGDGDHADHGDRRVEIPSENGDDYEVTVESIATGRLADMVEATATVDHDVERVAHISPLVDGQISNLQVSLGDTVEAGQTVAQMQSVELGTARAAVREAEAKRDVAESNFDRQKRLEQKGIASERAFVEARGELKKARAEMEAAEARLETYGVQGGSGPYYPLRSHIDGRVVEQHAAVGETKGADDSLFVVADQSVVWIIGKIAEEDIHRVENGMRAIVTMEAYPDRHWRGTVDWVAGNVDKETRVLPIRVVLENPERRLKPGMFATVQLKPEHLEDSVPLVPVDAIQKIDGHDAVFVPGDEEGTFKLKRVEMGAESGGLVEVTSGLSDGDSVVTAGAFDLKAALTAQGRSAAHSH